MNRTVAKGVSLCGEDVQNCSLSVWSTILLSASSSSLSWLSLIVEQALLISLFRNLETLVWCYSPSRPIQRGKKLATTHWWNISNRPLHIVKHLSHSAKKNLLWPFLALLSDTERCEVNNPRAFQILLFKRHTSPHIIRYFSNCLVIDTYQLFTIGKIYFWTPQIQ